MVALPNMNLFFQVKSFEPLVAWYPAVFSTPSSSISLDDEPRTTAELSEWPCVAETLGMEYKLRTASAMFLAPTFFQSSGDRRASSAFLTLFFFRFHF